MNVLDVYIENGNLFVNYKRGDIIAKKDLGKVVGEKGEKGDRGERGLKGEKGDNGISPTFSIESDGHLYADYDNPYNGQ